MRTDIPGGLTARRLGAKSWWALAGWGACGVVLGAIAQPIQTKGPLRFEVSLRSGLVSSNLEGRLFVVLSPTNNPEPREGLGRTGLDAPPAFARDIHEFQSGDTVTLGEGAFGFPVAHLGELPAGDYFVQALVDRAYELRMPNAPGNLYSVPQQLHVDPVLGGVFHVELSEQLAEEELPPDSEEIKYVKVPSRLLTAFHRRPMFLRAGILLPANYLREPSRKYPLWVRVGGFNTRCWALQKLSAHEAFRDVWQSAKTPPFILLQLDGAGPYGDPYYVDSANNGPYGEALTTELIPYVEARFRALGQSQARVLSGTSTGGWVSLALQIFYPDFFNGTWSSSPDPVDFRAFELVNVYEGTNAYVNEFGNERPSERALDGDVVLTMRREVGMENLLGRGNSYVSSGGQWGAWNATFGPRGRDGNPLPIWDAQTGTIDHSVAEAWKKYDLRLVLRKNWRTLGPKLRGKLHIAAGEADQYFLNNAVHLLDEDLSELDPHFSRTIAYGRGKGHGWMDISLAQMLEEMRVATSGRP